LLKNWQWPGSRLVRKNDSADDRRRRRHIRKMIMAAAHRANCEEEVDRERRAAFDVEADPAYMHRGDPTG
jgi:hypothetical protein